MWVWFESTTAHHRFANANRRYGKAEGRDDAVAALDPSPLNGPRSGQVNDSGSAVLDGPCLPAIGFRLWPQ
jgi:hypothetical protein